jgi:ketosteroid isomerase-like protein
VSQENVEIVKRFADAFNERDVETFVALTTPEFEWTTSMATVEGEVFIGRKGIETYFERMIESWAEFRVVSGEFRDLADTDSVLWHGDLAGRGRGSGVPVTTPLDFICDVRDGKIWRLRSFLDHAEALRAAGLTE